MRRLLIIVFLLLSLGYVNYLALATERQIDSGRTVYMELAPVDPRSLLQGDYMILRYAVDEDIYRFSGRDEDSIPKGGRLVLTLDSDNVGTFTDFVEADLSESLPPNQVAVRYTGSDNWNISFAPRSFFFQEGNAEIYEDAEYAELRLTNDGRIFLIGLRDGQLRQLGPSVE